MNETCKSCGVKLACDEITYCVCCEGAVELEELRDRLQVAENALRTIASAKCRCDAYVGPCGCGARAVEIAEDVIGCKACFATGRRYDGQTLKPCEYCSGTGKVQP